MGHMITCIINRICMWKKSRCIYPILKIPSDRIPLAFSNQCKRCPSHSVMQILARSHIKTSDTLITNNKDGNIVCAFLMYQNETVLKSSFVVDHRNKDARIVLLMNQKKTDRNPSSLLLEVRLTCSNDHSLKIKNASG